MDAEAYDGTHTQNTPLWEEEELRRLEDAAVEPSGAQFMPWFRHFVTASWSSRQEAQGSGWNPKRFWSILTLGVADFAGHAGARRGTPGRTGHAGANWARWGSTGFDEITYRKFIVFSLVLKGNSRNPGHAGANWAPRGEPGTNVRWS